MLGLLRFGAGILEDQNEEITMRVLSMQFRQVLDELEKMRNDIVSMDDAIKILDDRLALLESVHGRMAGRVVD
jgi:hypothetical protein